MRNLTALSIVAVLASAPVAAQNSQQGQSQPQQAQEAQQPQGMSEEARACLDDLQQIDRQLAQMGYGRVGPGGYGVYGDPYARAARPPEARLGTGTVGRLGVSTPRGDMFALMRAGYVLAIQGYDTGCREVVSAVRDIGQRYEEAIRTGQLDQADLQTWRGEFLASAVSVSEAEHPLHADNIIGSDIRNLRDEDLGDISDVVIGADGNIQYVIVRRGGFLGFGGDEIPVRWSDLRITPAPHHDTFVLDVSEQALENAPRLEVDALTAGSGPVEAVEQYWEQIAQQRQ